MIAIDIIDYPIFKDLCGAGIQNLMNLELISVHVFIFDYLFTAVNYVVKQNSMLSVCPLR